MYYKAIKERNYYEQLGHHNGLYLERSNEYVNEFLLQNKVERNSAETVIRGQIFW